MLGQRFLPTSYQAKLQQMDYEKHMKRLETIHKTSKSVAEEKEDLWRSTFDNTKSKHQKFQTSEKLLTIDKTNQNLLDKLVKISRNQKPPLFNKTATWTTHPGTLNTGFRKMQLEKIALENEAMAKRLISQHGSVNRKQLDKDFEKHQEFSKNVQKISSPKIDKLLPLRSPKLQETSSKGFKVSKKKNNKKNSASVQIDRHRSDLSKEDSKPSEDTQSKEHIPTPHSQEAEPEAHEKLNQPASEPQGLENENKEESEGQTQVETEVKPAEEQANSVSKREKETEAKVEEETDNKVGASEEEKDAVKPQEAIQNKSQVSNQESKRSTTVQPPANFEKATNTNRKESPNNIDSQDNKSKSAVREVAQITTTRSKNGMDTSQVEEPQVEKSQVEKSQVEKSQLEKSQVEKSQVDKSQVEKSQLKESQVEKSQVEKSLLGHSQVKESQVENSARKSARNESQNTSPVQSQQQKEAVNYSQNQEEGKGGIQTQSEPQQEEEVADDHPVKEEEAQNQKEDEEVKDVNQSKGQEKEQEQHHEQTGEQDDGKVANE